MRRRTRAFTNPTSPAESRSTRRRSPLIVMMQPTHFILDVVLEKGLPCRRRRFGWPHPILLHRRFGHPNAHLAQFSHNPGRAPRRVRLPHVPDQLAHLLGNGRATRLASLAQAPPIHVCPLESGVLHTLRRRSTSKMDARLAHAALMAFHRFQRGSKSSRARFRVASFIVSGSSF
jgi:hypothetical protein